MKNSLPPKLQKIEDQLKKYSDEAVIQMQTCRDMQKQDDQYLFDQRQEMRQYEMNKLRMNKTYLENQKVFYQENYVKYKARERQRLENFQRVEDFLTKKIKDKILLEQYEDKKQYVEGIEYFYNKCTNLGIELKKDADKPKPAKNSYLSSQTLMSKIRERNQQRSLAMKEKEKRNRKMQVDSQNDYERLSKQKNEENLIEQYIGLNRDSKQFNQQTMLEKRKQDFIFQQNCVRQESESVQQLELFKQTIDQKFQASLDNEKIRQQEFQQRQKEYRLINYRHKVNLRNKRLQLVSEDVMNFFLDFTEDCFKMNEEKEYPQIPSQFYRHVCNRFEQNLSYQEQKMLNIFKDIQMQKQSVAPELEDMNINDYFFRENMWELDYQQLGDSHEQLEYSNSHLSEVVDRFINFIDKPFQKPKALHLANHQLPVKISLISPSEVYCTSFANLLVQKYNAIIINPYELLKSYVKQAFPVEVVDPKKKATKGKPVEDETKQIPHDIMELAQEAKHFVDENQEFSDEILLKAVIHQIQAHYHHLDHQHYQDQIDEAKEQHQKYLEEKKQQESQRHNRKQKQCEEESMEQKIQHLIQKRDHAYTKGFILINFPQTKEQSDLLETKFEGFIEKHKLINQKAETKKNQFLPIIPRKVQEKIKLPKSGLGLLINLGIPKEEYENVCQWRKLDPVTQNVYNQDDNPPPKDVKGLIERLVPYDQANNYEPFNENIDNLKQFQENFKQVYHEIQYDNKFQVLENIDNLISASIIKFNKKDDKKKKNIFDVFQTEEIQIEQAEFFYKNLLKINNSYAQEINQTCKDLKDKRKIMIKRVIELQKSFIAIVEKQNPKMTSLHEFQETFNRFLNEQQQLAKKQTTVKGLEKKIENLYEIFWDFLQNKKQLAVKEREDIIQSQWIENEQDTVFKLFLKLMQIEINKLLQTLRLIFMMKEAYEENEELQIEQIILDPFKNKTFTVNQQDLNQFDVIFEKVERAYSEIEQVIKKSIEHTKIKTQKNRIIVKGDLNNLLNKAIHQEVLVNRLIHLINILNVHLKDIEMIKIALFEKLNDWIIYGLKTENDLINECIKDIKNCVQNQQRCQVKEFQIRISDKIKPFNYFKDEIYCLPFYETRKDSRFTIIQLKILQEDLHTLSNNYFIDIKYFKHFFKYRLKNYKNYPQKIKDLQEQDINKIVNKFCVNNDKIDMQKLLTQFILLGAKLPTQKNIDEAKQKLENKQSLLEMVNQEFWFDQCEKEVHKKCMMFNEKQIELVINRTKFIKKLLYEVNSINDEFNIDKFIQNITPIQMIGDTYLDSIIF